MGSAHGDQARRAAAEQLLHHSWSLCTGPALPHRLSGGVRAPGRLWGTPCTGPSPRRVRQVPRPQRWPGRVPEAGSVAAALANLLNSRSSGKRRASFVGCLLSTPGAGRAPTSQRAGRLARHAARLQNAIKYLKSALQTKVNQT